AQIGKAFRNEINPRNFTFRSREFEQMELEYFCRPEQGMDLLAYWLKERIRFYEEIGLNRKRLHILDVADKDRAFYSKGTFDIEYEFPFGRQELEGVAYRTDYDLQQHIKASGKPLDYFDEETKERFVPHVVEPSAGVDRTVLALICDAYDEDTAPDEKGKMETRVVMRFHPRMAPIKCAIFPLLRNKEALVAKAREGQEIAPHNHGSCCSECSWRRVLFCLHPFVPIPGSSRPAVESATMVLWFRRHGNLAKSRSGSDVDGDCRRIFLAKPFLQPLGVFSLVGYYLTD